MITYSKAAAKSITAAVKKAKTVKPMVRPVVGEFGKYTVCGSAGDCYTVTYAKQGSEFTADCDCKGGKAGRVCYHIVAASALYKKAVSDRAQARYTVRATDPDGFSYDSGYDNMATAQAEIDLLADSKAKYWLGFRFDLYDNLLPGNPPIWSRSVKAKSLTVVSADDFAVKLFGEFSRIEPTEEELDLMVEQLADDLNLVGYNEVDRAADHADVFGF